MKLSILDDKFIKLETRYGETVWGACMYNSREYNMHEYGRNEDGLQIANFLFFRSDIKSVELVEPGRQTDNAAVAGPDRSASEDGSEYIPPFDMIQEENVRDDFDTIEDELLYGDERNVLRMLACIDHYLELGHDFEFPDRGKIIALLDELAGYTEDESVRKEAARLYEKWNNK